MIKTTTFAFQACIIIIINVSIISFRGQLGLDRLPSNVHSVGNLVKNSTGNIDDARTGGQIAILGLIGQGAMLVETDLTIYCVILASNGTCLLVHPLVKLELILGHHVQEMSQASSLSSLLVMFCKKSEHLFFDELS